MRTLKTPEESGVIRIDIYELEILNDRFGVQAFFVGFDN